MLVVFIVLALTVIFSLLMEHMTVPGRPCLYHRGRLWMSIPVVLFFLGLFMLSYRPLFSSALTLVALLVIIVANNVKVRTVREPLVYSDFALIKQVVGHPRLYLSYVGPVKLLAVVSVGIASTVAAITIEPPVTIRTTPSDFLPMTIYFLVVVGLFFVITWDPLRTRIEGVLGRFTPAANIEDDVARLGLINCLFLYYFLSTVVSGESVKAHPSAKDLTLSKVINKPQHDVVVVQNESFFDARSVMQKKVHGFLNAYDRFSKEALFKGRLEVPAWGANTQRTEYAFLSGLPLQALGMHQYNPFLSVGLRPQWTLASHLRAQGYRTICVHPYYKSFFNRDRVYPNLGFDEFIDIADFVGAERCGPYVSDMAVAAKVREILAANDGPPVFVFVITMENHGQWEKHRIDVDDEIREAVPDGSNAFACYLQHLVNADRMIESLVETLKQRRRGSVFCFFGDHQPSFPDVFSCLGHNDPRTDYFIWKKGMTGVTIADIEVNSLGLLLLNSLFLEDEEPVMPRTALGAA